MPKVPFPHMMVHDTPLFASFVLTPDARPYTRWEFDVQVGDGHVTRAEWDPDVFRTAYDVSKLRIDAVGWQGGIPTVFEVKPMGRISGFGQLMAYKYFYRRDKGLEPNLAYITDWMPPDVATVCAAYGIRVFIVGEATEDELLAACRIVQADCSQLIRLPTLP